jgi:hypothetical protein
MLRKLNLLCWLCIAAVSTAYAQTSKLNGVYVGAELYNTPFNGMQINYIVLYFKGDGTLNNKLNQPDWRTKTTGTYTINGGTVQINFKTGDESKKYTLAANGNLQSTAGIRHTLHKVKKISSVPAGAYEKKSASSSGGMGTGMPAVGAFSSDYLYFDGKGNFSADRSSVVGVSGESVAGKFDRDSKSSGTYKLGDAEITLAYGSGKTTRHSFFYSPPTEEDLILLDGDFYFRDDKAQAKQSSTSAIKRKAQNEEPKPNTGVVSAPTSAANLLAKLRRQYGGERIDQLNTVREVATVNGNMQIIATTDVVNKRIRAEVKQGGKTVLIKQVDGNEGWQWLNGSKTTLSQADKDDLKLSLYQGIMGLRKGLNSGFATGTVTASGADQIITFYQGKNKIIYLIGNDNNLKGNAYSIAGNAPSISVYKNFTNKDGIGYPATTESSDGKTKITSNTSSIEFNPTLTADTWKLPN